MPSTKTTGQATTNIPANARTIIATANKANNTKHKVIILHASFLHNKSCKNSESKKEEDL